LGSLDLTVLAAVAFTFVLRDASGRSECERSRAEDYADRHAEPPKPGGRPYFEVHHGYDIP
jgi:hypothetical protein